MSLFSFDDTKVQNYIDWSMKLNINSKPIDSQLSRAYASLIGKREKDDPKDEDDELAAAEHYMYARSQVCAGKSSVEMMALLTAGYDPGKMFGYAPIPFVVRKLAGHTWSYPSASSMRWGFRGIRDGEHDRHAISKDPAAQGA